MSATSDAPELTFAVPFHGRVDYLREALESVLAQSDPGWQLLVCDDSGEGAAHALVADLSRGIETRVRYVRNESTLGMVANWNRCLDLAFERTDWVTLLHGDDRLTPIYLGLVRELFERHPSASAAFCGADIIDARGARSFSFADSIKTWFEPREARGPSYLLEGESSLRGLMRGNFIMCPSLCFRREALGRRRFSGEWKQVQDLELTSRLLMDGDCLAGTRRVAYVYRRHAAGATERQSASLLRFREEIELFGRVADRAEQLGWPGAARTARRRAIVRLHLLQRALGESLRLRPAAAWRCLRLAWAPTSSA